MRRVTPPTRKFPSKTCSAQVVHFALLASNPLFLPCKKTLDKLPEEHNQKPEENEDEFPEFIGDLHLRPR